jgi:predicted N-formylglutamate amidohydrolase
MSRKAPATRVIITCEHGGNRIPAPYRTLFRPHAELLESHRGYDPGALVLAREFASALDAKLFYSTTSRLLVELNRSPTHPQVFSGITRRLPRSERAALAARYYEPYRKAVENEIATATAAGHRVLHISSHSFTPEFDGLERRTDLGLLYDPGRERETRFCLAWKERLERAAPHLTVRRNYPYRGSLDGFTTALRRRHAPEAYRGIELEVNQKYPLGDAGVWRALRRMLVATLAETVAE